MKKVYGMIDPKLNDSGKEDDDVCKACKDRQTDARELPCRNCHEYEHHKLGKYVPLEPAITAITQMWGGYKVVKRKKGAIKFMSKSLSGDTFEITEALRVQDFADVVADLAAQHTLWGNRNV